MKLGITLRTMGPQSAPETVLACARAAEDAGLDDLWVPDHVAIPPDDAEGSGGRYLDPLATLAWLAGATDRIGLGTGVLIVPYRPPLPTAKWIATVQELSGGRLLLGVGIGWMKPEFKALGVDRSRRGRLTDETLEFLLRCFEADEVDVNGQRFLFLPRPKRPPIFVGGAAPHALERTVRLGEGWMPIGTRPEDLAKHATRLRDLARDAGRPTPEIVVMTSLPLDDLPGTQKLVRAFAEAGATRLVHGARYTDAAAFEEVAEKLVARARPAMPDTDGSSA